LVGHISKGVWVAKAITGGELYVFRQNKTNNMNKKILYVLMAIILLVLVYYFLIPKYSFPIIPPHKAGPLGDSLLMGDEVNPILLRCNIITGRCDEVNYSSEGRRWVPFVK
jgi:hypothetical protein